ncbi:alkaline phosphatase family protein [Thermophagus sp. OGC60D27]|uniref:alkaline phosphatase family protein n=1 Tax=Thermophagus sp. OGC60D27 TaxID=3458415 RepID=UPI0040378190
MESGDERRGYVVMLSLDGFRWDYSTMYHTPVLDSIAQNGTKAKTLIPSFPTKTFPNHYSIVTGLYPDHHGLINNNFFNTAIGREYKISDRTAVQDPRFYKGEPFWVTAERQGVKTASYFWVGSETSIKGVHPSIWKEYDGRISYEQRIDSVIAWLQLPLEQRPRLITLYFDQPDRVGHQYGPESIETKEVVERLDSLVGVFCQKKNQLSIADSIDFIIVSDHGMAPTYKEKAVALNRYIPSDRVNYYGSNPIFLLEPQEGFVDSVYTVLSQVEGLNVWQPDEIPDSLHFGTDPNISSLIVCAKPGWSIYRDSLQFSDGGTHGYSPYFSDMHAIFYAIGPSFKQNYMHPSFANIEIYNLICALLNLEPGPNDGELSHISAMINY